MGRRSTNVLGHFSAPAVVGAVVGLWLLAAPSPPPVEAAPGVGEWLTAQDHLHVAPQIGPHDHSQTPLVS